MTTKKKADPKASHKVEVANYNANNTILGAKKPLTKINRVLLHLRTNTRGLNRFEAEHLGEHCLNTTIATLRREGWLIAGEWEHLPTRFGSPARVLRYRHIGYRNPAEVAEEIAAIIGNGGV
ncbi:hypothetical protein NE850_11565 [Paraburkholderia sp. USG1]|uniref:hypothetical protein n=1 Tax=Paraburkholderia sp. USG1 TaxID=2952268 RepID=UPI0028634522|nr:hypothetical protein [Paraburkholderia sp. USG1]MDR8396977.1 hypothetical protein [Paraburkholderia sp. USG1]